MSFNNLVIIDVIIFAKKKPLTNIDIFQQKLKSFSNIDFN